MGSWRVRGARATHCRDHRRCSAGDLRLQCSVVPALGTIGVFLSQIRRGRRPLASPGWTLLVLSIGLAVGLLLNLALSPTAFEQLALSPLQIQALPAGLLLWAAALFLA